MHNSTETQQIEIPAVLGTSKLKIRRDGTGEVIGIGITTPDYNVTTVVRPAEFLLAARTLCEEPAAPARGPQRRVFLMIQDERARQEKLVDAGKLPWNCASAMVPLKDKSLAWTEECLEASREFLAHACAGLAVDRYAAKERLRKELVQVAAVTVAILESMEGQP